MKTKNKHQNSGGEVMELAREAAALEQYWIVGDRSEPRKPPKNYKYVEELMHLQIELIKMQECVRQGRPRSARSPQIAGARRDRAPFSTPGFRRMIPCPSLFATRRMAAVSASRAFPRVPANVPSPNRQRPFADGNETGAATGVCGG